MNSLMAYGIGILLVIAGFKIIHRLILKMVESAE